MPLPQRWHKGNKPPLGFEVIEPTLEALEHELRDKIKETNEKLRKTESLWPVHQINWQKSRYVYDMYYKYNRISKQVYQYCIHQKLIDAALIAKWKKPGYERLCSTYVINPSNYKFGTTSICRVPIKDRAPEARSACDPTTGCMGCASGKGSGPLNIFGNKYGQHLAAVQVAREERMKKIQEDTTAREAGDDDEETDGDSDDNSENDFGPKEVTGIWAGAQELKKQATQLVGEDDAGDDETDDEDNEELPMPLSKKVRRA